MYKICMGIQLGEEFGPAQFTQGRHKGLVTIIPRPEITPLKGMGGCQLSHLFAIAKDAKLGPATHYIFST